MLIIGLGSNVGDRLANLRQAVILLRQQAKILVHQVSPVYESDPLVLEDAAPEDTSLPYLNAALSCETTLEPLELLEVVKDIERKIGRPSVYQRWSPRLIDIDILAWGDRVIYSERLKVPHVDLCERPFALFPLADLAPFWRYCVTKKKHSGKTAAAIVSKWGSRFSGEAPLHTRQLNHRIDTPQVVGILNITPDSFSDGGSYNLPEQAVAQAQKLFIAGADVIDIGAESTRPNNGAAITPKEEWRRLQPILEAITMHWKDIPFRPKISVDTRNAVTAERAIEKFNVDWINDVSGCDNLAMRSVLAAASHQEVKIVFMHHLGIPPNSEMILSDDQDLVQQIYIWGMKRIEELLAAGIKIEQMIIDIGIGFGKSAIQSFELIQRIREFNKFCWPKIPLLIGHSRKLFLSQFTTKPFAERDIETVIISADLCRKDKHVDFIRVHNVELNMRAMKMAAALKLV